MVGGQQGDAHSLPLKLNSHAISSSMPWINISQQASWSTSLVPLDESGCILKTIPALLDLASSLRRSSSFSSYRFPAYSRPRTFTLLLGRAGRSSPQTMSTKFSRSGTRPLPPFLTILSLIFRASA